MAEIKQVVVLWMKQLPFDVRKEIRDEMQFLDPNWLLMFHHCLQLPDFVEEISMVGKGKSHAVDNISQCLGFRQLKEIFSQEKEEESEEGISFEKSQS